MDLPVRKGSECGKAEALREGVDARVAEEARAVVVGVRDGGVLFEALPVECGEVVGFVEVFEHAGGGFEVVAGEVDAARGGGVFKLGAGVVEEGGLYEEALVCGEGGDLVAGADDEFDDWGAEVAGASQGLRIADLEEEVSCSRKVVRSAASGWIFSRPVSSFSTAVPSMPPSSPISSSPIPSSMITSGSAIAPQYALGDSGGIVRRRLARGRDRGQATALVTVWRWATTTHSSD